MTAIDLVVTDLDGTLADGDGLVHPRTLAALAELDRRGVPWLVATGRRRRSAAAVLGRAGLRPSTVVLDGALGIDLATAREFHRAPFHTGDAARALETFLAHGSEPCVYVADPVLDVVVGDHPSTHPAHLASLGDDARRVDLRAGIERWPVLAFGVISRPRELLEGIAAQLHPVATAAVTRDVVHGGATLVAVPREITKWSGVVAFCRQHGLDAARVLAVGDAENDVTMLQQAAVAVAVEGSPAAVSAVADLHLPGPGSGGWAAVVDLL